GDEVHRDAAEVHERERRLPPAADDVVSHAVLVDDAHRGRVARHAVRLLLLPEALSAEAIRTTAEDERPTLHVRPDLREDALVVVDEVALRVALVGPEHLRRVRDRDRHARTHSSGRLSSRRPRKTGWRSFLSSVHSWNEICATSFGASHTVPFSRGGSTKA